MSQNREKDTEWMTLDETEWKERNTPGRSRMGEVFLLEGRTDSRRASGSELGVVDVERLMKGNKRDLRMKEKE